MSIKFQKAALLIHHPEKSWPIFGFPLLIPKSNPKPGVSEVASFSSFTENSCNIVNDQVNVFLD